jgi:hypothetical protein
LPSKKLIAVSRLPPESTYQASPRLRPLGSIGRPEMTAPAKTVDPSFWTDQLFDDDSDMQGMEFGSQVSETRDQAMLPPAPVRQDWRGR